MQYHASRDLTRSHKRLAVHHYQSCLSEKGHCSDNIQQELCNTSAGPGLFALVLSLWTATALGSVRIHRHSLLPMGMYSRYKIYGAAFGVDCFME